MSKLNQIELIKLKRQIELQEVNYQKFMSYSSVAVDPQIKQIFNKAAQDALNEKQKLISFIV